MDLASLDQSLLLARDYVLSSQGPDGSWSGSVETDPRATAFYLFTINALGYEATDETDAMERYLSSRQLPCGAWQDSPDGPSDLDVTLVCVLALEDAATTSGQEAGMRAQRWLCGQRAPKPDSFWRGLLAIKGDVPFASIPYVSPRIVSVPDWLHPNLYDFSFLRIAVVTATLLQCHGGRTAASSRIGHARSARRHDRRFEEWKERWITECGRPAPGLFSWLCGALRQFDRAISPERHSDAALAWLLEHQEEDGSFFSSVHMTSVAVITLHRLDPVRHERQVRAGLEALRNWQRCDGNMRWQQFTDSTNWDTILFLDLLPRLGLSVHDPQIDRAREYVHSSQITHKGDWSHRARGASDVGAWGFQRVGKWYPDADDTVMALNALLNLRDPRSSEVVRRGVEWLLAMQSSSGGWASWDRNDRGWMRLPGGGPWFARDLDASEITARVVSLFARIARGDFGGLDHLLPRLAEAKRRGIRWLQRNSRNGIWFGRWFTHYIYGTSHVLEAFEAVCERAHATDKDLALTWLISIANADGGYGESADSARAGQFVGAPSTPFHTACALSAMIHAGASRHPAAERAVTWLLRDQNPDGGWTNRDFFAAGVPGLWYGNFELTPTYFAAMALSKYRQDRFGGS